jgi:DNA polymerase-3 subunit epsilon
VQRDSSRLVEAGGRRFRLNGRELAIFGHLIDPQVSMSDEAQEVYGITDRMVRGKPTIEHVLPSFVESLGNPDTNLLAHNVLFNLGFLVMAPTRLGMPYLPFGFLDTLDLARRLYPTCPSHSLENVTARLKIANSAEHCLMPG